MTVAFLGYMPIHNTNLLELLNFWLLSSVSNVIIASKLYDFVLILRISRIRRYVPRVLKIITFEMRLSIS